MASNDFDSGSERELDIICNMISMMLLEYDKVTEVTGEEDGFLKKCLPISLCAIT